MFMPFMGFVNAFKNSLCIHYDRPPFAQTDVVGAHSTVLLPNCSLAQTVFRTSLYSTNESVYFTYVKKCIVYSRSLAPSVQASLPFSPSMQDCTVAA